MDETFDTITTCMIAAVVLTHAYTALLLLLRVATFSVTKSSCCKENVICNNHNSCFFKFS